MIPLHTEAMPDHLVDLIAPTMLDIAFAFPGSIGIARRREGKPIQGLLPGEDRRCLVLHRNRQPSELADESERFWLLDHSIAAIDARIVGHRYRRHQSIPIGIILRPLSLLVICGEDEDRTGALKFAPHATGHDVLAELRALNLDFPDMFAFVGEASDD